MRKIERIFIHCTAGNQNQTINDLQKEFKKKGWKSPGYHYVIDKFGNMHRLLEESEVSNGVHGYNATSINVAYIGGIDAKGKAVDNRTDEQKKALIILIKKLKERYPDAEVLGHRDISPDKNNNGIVDPWERIKECPCFNVKEEYGKIIV